ncbi:ABC transporter ATP-binding protein [Jiangella asiatica]|uniref:ABC transporter ATP-binding protein n=1 Tax=Jiangella asiatica TaxID=2530372 RepID=A0A4R5DMP5_9ACTN|nr:ABC transporter ATP-binding protein [Jiangella asiatica]TDE12175.1 ABC transporter ATP-binding protein [Jiangella asiatica]
MALLEVSDLRTEFTGKNGTVAAVDGVSFTVSRGEALGLVGESGCGKSVTALSLLRLLPASARIAGGSIRLDGRDLLALGEREIRRIRGREVAMIFQDPMTSLNPIMPVGRQIAELLECKLHLSRRRARLRVIELLEMVGIPSPTTRVDAFAHQLSGGMRQRIVIAMALSCQPKLIIADEPTTALDVTIQAQILSLLRALASDLGTALILITHDLGVVAGMTQRIHVMYGGRIVEKATTQELFANPRMPYTWGLLRSLPRLDHPRADRLTPIDGAPPDLADGAAGCRFEPRCGHRQEICGASEPGLVSAPRHTIAEDGHEVRCWATQPDGWLADATTTAGQP